MMTSRDEATAVHAVPAQWLECGFRLLVLRELRAENEPPAFAWIEQHLLRTPQRLTRHGLFFGLAFRPEIMAWLSEHLGRPSLARGLLWSQDDLSASGLHGACP